MADYSLYHDVPNRLEGSPVFQKMWGRIHRRNMNFMAAICGEVGSGKSYAALSLAEMLDPDFSIEQVAFSVEEFVELVNEDYPEGSFIVMEESSVSMNAQTWWDSDQIQVGNILDTWRHQNRGAIFTLPAFGQLQKNARGRMHGLGQTRGIDYQEEVAALRYRYIQQDSDTGKIYKKYHRLPHPETGVETQYTWIGLPKPSQELLDAYEERKEQFTDELNQEILNNIRGEGSGDNGRTAKDIKQEVETDGVEQVVSIHGGNGTKYIDAELIEVEYECSRRDAKKVKKLLERDDAADLNDADTNTTHASSA